MGAAVGTHLAFAPSRATAGLVHEAAGPATAEDVQNSLHVLWEHLIELREDGYQLTGVRRSQDRLGQFDFARLHGFVLLRLRWGSGGEEVTEFARLDWGQNGVQIFGPKAHEGCLHCECSQERELQWATLGLVAIAWAIAVAIDWVRVDIMHISVKPEKMPGEIERLQDVMACMMIVAAALGSWSLAQATKKVQAGGSTTFVATMFFLAPCQGGWSVLTMESSLLLCQHLLDLNEYLQSISHYLAWIPVWGTFIIVLLGLAGAYVIGRRGNLGVCISILSTCWSFFASMLIMWSGAKKWPQCWAWIQVFGTLLLGLAATFAALREHKHLRGDTASYITVQGQATSVQRLADYIRSLSASDRGYHLRHFNCWHFANDVITVLTAEDFEEVLESPGGGEVDQVSALPSSLFRVGWAVVATPALPIPSRDASAKPSDCSSGATSYTSTMATANGDAGGISASLLSFAESTVSAPSVATASTRFSSAGSSQFAGLQASPT